jgi:hypothetical protein
MNAVGGSADPEEIGEGHGASVRRQRQRMNAILAL